MSSRFRRAVFTSTVALLVGACGTSESQKSSGASGAGGAHGGAAAATAGTSGASAASSTGSGGSGKGGDATGGSASGGKAGAVSTAGMPASAGQIGSGGAGGSGAGTTGGVSGSAGGTDNGGSAGSGLAGTGQSGTGGGGSDAGGAPGGTPVEEALASLPTDRQEHGVVAANGEVYVIGGYSPNITASVIAYDPDQDSWHSVADFPGPLNHPVAGVVNDKIYVTGFYAGTSLTGPASGQSFVYDPKADSWTEKKELPGGTERAGGCVAIMGTDMYVFGGGTSGNATSFASVYDTVGDSWTELPALPETREHCSAFASGGKLYIAGGRTHTIPEFRPSTLEFDPVTQTYVEKTPIPTPRGGAAGAVLDGRLFLFGGEGADNDDGVFPDIQAYDATNDSWETFPPMKIPRHGFGAATLGERIYLAGGAIRQGGAASDENSVFYFE